MKKTPLENWIRNRVMPGSSIPLTQSALEAYQLRALQETVRHVRRQSSFYRQRLKDVPEQPLSHISDFRRLPFTTVADIRNDPFAFLCVSQDDVARVVTLQTSGTTGSPKRFFFTESDLELTIDFFHHGMSTLVSPGQRVLILMPGMLPFSVGDLLVKGLDRMNVTGIVHGPVKDPEVTVEQIIDLQIDSLVGIPVQVLGLARSPAADRIPAGRLKSVLLSADYVPQAVIRALTERWHCPIYQHYGMTETGYGAAVECAALSGYHIREADLFFEIVDPKTGVPVDVGETGEVVVTTLTRKAMPLVRYRTGDLGRFIPEPCPCGTVLSRLDWVQGRMEGRIDLGGKGFLSAPMLDNAVFTVPGVMNYDIRLERKGAKNRLFLSIYPVADAESSILEAVSKAVQALPALCAGIKSGDLDLSVSFRPDMPTVSTGPIKRTIEVTGVTENRDIL